MRRLLLIAAGLLVLAGAVGRAQAPGGPGVSYPPLLLRDEGTDQGRMTRALNFTGAGVSCSAASGVGTCNISGGGGGPGNFVDTSIPLTSAGTTFQATVTGQRILSAWRIGEYSCSSCSSSRTYSLRALRRTGSRS